MLIDGLKMLDGSDIENLTIASGSSFPNNPDKAELFYLDTINGTNQIGLYCYNGTEWELVGSSSGGALVQSGQDFPTQQKDASLFYKLSGDIGLYIYLDSDQSWHSVGNSNLATVATSGSYTDLTDKPVEKTKLSEFTNDSGFVLISAVNAAVNNEKSRAMNVESKLTLDVTNETIRAANAEQALSDRIALIDGGVGVANVARTGSYNDLIDTPVIPTKTSDLSNDTKFQTETDLTNAISAITTSISNKANSATKLAGYGITDAYTQDQVTALLANKSNIYNTLAGYGIADAVSTQDLGKSSTATKVGVATLNDRGKLTSTQLPTNLQSLADDNVTVVTLDPISGKIPASQLPSYVDDVLEFADLASFPVSTDAETNKIYVALDTNLIYRWSGSQYIEISSAGLADAATKLYTARTISLSGKATGSVTFDGSQDVDIAVSFPGSKLDDYGITDSVNISQLGIKSTTSKTGVATLNNKGEVVDTQLPDYLDDVREYSSLTTFPAEGEIKTIFVAQDTNLIYRWDGTDYVELSSAGIATSAATLTVARTISLSNNAIGSVVFDGSQDVALNVTGLPNHYTKTIIDGKFNTFYDDFRRFTSDINSFESNISSTLSAMQNNINNSISGFTTTLASKADKASTLSGYGLSQDAYTQTEVDNLLKKKVNISQLGVATSGTGLNVITGIATLNTDGKVETTQLPSIPAKVSDLTNDLDYQTFTQVDTAIQVVAGVSAGILNDLTALTSQLSTTETNLASMLGNLNSKADKSTTLAGYGITNAYDKDHTYSKTEVDNKLDLKANSSSVYTQDQVNTLLLNKSDKYTTLSGYGITDAVANSAKGVALGVASLDGSAKVNLSQLPMYALNDSQTYDALFVDFSTVQTLTNKKFSGINKMATMLENVNVVAAAPSTTQNFDIKTASSYYFTTAASANFTLNIRGDGSNTLNSVLAIGDSVNIIVLVTNGASAYYPNVVNIDSVAIAPKWIGGASPSGGNPNSIDCYTYSIIKTADAAYTVLAAQSKFA